MMTALRARRVLSASQAPPYDSQSARACSAHISCDVLRVAVLSQTMQVASFRRTLRREVVFKVRALGGTREGMRSSTA
jgi:hypothetical protein